MDSHRRSLATLTLESRIATSNNLAGLTIMVYELLCTLDKEIWLVWLSPWSLMNTFHIIIRYYATSFLLVNAYAFGAVKLTNKLWVIERILASLFTTDDILRSKLRAVQYFSDMVRKMGAGAFISFMNIALLLRIFALYGRNNLMGAFLVILWLVETSCFFVFMAEAFSLPQMLANPWPRVLPGCFPLKPANYAMVIRAGGTAAAFQCFYLVMTLMALRKRNCHISTQPLMKVFFRDSIVYSMSILVVYVFNAILVKSVPSGILQNIGLTWIMVILPIVAGRLILNLKHVGQKSSSSSFSSSSADNRVGLFTSVLLNDSFDL